MDESYQGNRKQGNRKRDALDLWDHLFDGTEGHLCISTGTRNDAGKIPDMRNKSFRYPAQARDALRYAQKASERGQEAYFCTALLRGKGNRKQENALPLSALYMDGDGAEIPP